MVLLDRFLGTKTKVAIAPNMVIIHIPYQSFGREENYATVLVRS